MICSQNNLDFMWTKALGAIKAGLEDSFLFWPVCFSSGTLLRLWIYGLAEWCFHEIQCNQAYSISFSTTNIHRLCSTLFVIGRRLRTLKDILPFECGTWECKTNLSFQLSILASYAVVIWLAKNNVWITSIYILYFSTSNAWILILSKTLIIVTWSSKMKAPPIFNLTFFAAIMQRLKQIMLLVNLTEK